MFARLLITMLMLAASVVLLAPFAAAQGSDTVFDEADALSAAEEQDVQAAFEQVSEGSGEQLYAFLVSDTNVDVADRPEFLEEKASEAGAPPDADVIVVDTLEGAREEAGDLIQAERTGALSWENAVPLEDILRTSERPEGTVVFKSVGHALWDLAAARTAFGD